MNTIWKRGATTASTRDYKLQLPFPCNSHSLQPTYLYRTPTKSTTNCLAFFLSLFFSSSCFPLSDIKKITTSKPSLLCFSQLLLLIHTTNISPQFSVASNSNTNSHLDLLILFLLPVGPSSILYTPTKFKDPMPNTFND